MYCTKCGADMGDAAVCPHCGKPAGQQSPCSGYMPGGAGTIGGGEAPAEGEHAAAVRRVLAGALSSRLFLAIGILLLATVLLGVCSYVQAGMSGASVSFVLTLLDGIGVLLVLAAAHKNGEAYLGENSGLIRVTLMIHYVIGWVAFGLVILVLLLLVSARSVMLSLLESLLEGGMDSILGYSVTGLAWSAGSAVSMLTAVYWGLIGGLAAAAILCFFRVLFYSRGLVRMGRDILTSLNRGDFYVTGVLAVRGWSLVMAILGILGALGVLLSGSVYSALASAAEAAAYILLYIWTGKYFIPRR